jgi:hypothetical protein
MTISHTLLRVWVAITRLDPHWPVDAWMLLDTQFVETTKTKQHAPRNNVDIPKHTDAIQINTRAIVGVEGKERSEAIAVWLGFFFFLYSCFGCYFVSNDKRIATIVVVVDDLDNLVLVQH